MIKKNLYRSLSFILMLVLTLQYSWAAYAAYFEFHPSNPLDDQDSIEREKAEKRRETAALRERFFQLRSENNRGCIDIDRRARPLLPQSELLLNPEDKKILRDYTLSAFADINKALWGKIPMTAEISSQVKGLQESLNKLPDYQGIVYRRTRLSDEALLSYEPGEKVSHLGFTSTSKDLGETTFFGSYIMVIYSLKGKDITTYSSRAYEQEVLFKSGTEFLVLGREGHKIYLEELTKDDEI